MGYQKQTPVWVSAFFVGMPEGTCLHLRLAQIIVRRPQAGGRAPLQHPGNIIEETQHPLRDASFFYGLSHGLKIARQLSIFAQPLAGPPFRVPQHSKKADTRMGICFFGTPEGTRTPDLLVRSQSLYPTELPAHTHLAQCACI